MFDNMIPAVIGDDSALVSLAREKCGGTVHLFDGRCRFRVRIKPYVKFHRVPCADPEIISMYLSGFSSDNPEYPVLIFASGEIRDAIQPFIEHNCIIWREDFEK